MTLDHFGAIQLNEENKENLQQITVTCPFNREALWHIGMSPALESGGSRLKPG